jgi:hypothetical protein
MHTGKTANSKARGPRIHDARVAALCLHHGVRELWSADRDFSVFPQLRVRNPLVKKLQLNERFTAPVGKRSKALPFTFAGSSETGPGANPIDCRKFLMHPSAEPARGIAVQRCSFAGLAILAEIFWRHLRITSREHAERLRPIRRRSGSTHVTASSGRVAVAETIRLPRDRRQAFGEVLGFHHFAAPPLLFRREARQVTVKKVG